MLEIEPETVYFIILKAREFDDKDVPGEDDTELSPAERVQQNRARLYDNDPVAQEIKDAIDGLNDDEQAALVALAWIGRGDFDAQSWDEAVHTARERHSGPTSDYLLGTPLLGDYLEEGIAQLGFAVEDLEPARA